MSNQIQTNPSLKVTIGQRVKFADPITGEPIYGTVHEIVSGTANVIKTVKVIREDGRVDFIEVANVVVLAVQLIEPLAKFGRWVANLFRKKTNRRPL